MPLGSRRGRLECGHPEALACRSRRRHWLTAHLSGYRLNGKPSHLVGIFNHDGVDLAGERRATERRPEVEREKIEREAYQRGFSEGNAAGKDWQPGRAGRLR